MMNRSAQHLGITIAMVPVMLFWHPAVLSLILLLVMFMFNETVKSVACYFRLHFVLSGVGYFCTRSILGVG